MVMYGMKHDEQYDTQPSHAWRGRETRQVGGPAPAPAHAPPTSTVGTCNMHKISELLRVTCAHMGLPSYINCEISHSIAERTVQTIPIILTVVLI